MFNYATCHITVSTFRAVLIGGCGVSLVALSFAQTGQAGTPPKSHRVDPKALIGMKSSSNHELYPDGWKRNLADGYGVNGPGLSGLVNTSTKQFALVLIKTANEGFLERKKVWAVMDAVEIAADANNDFRISRRCYFGERPKTLPTAFIAEVRFKKRCDMTTTSIQRAWRINMKSYEFEQLTDTKGLTCEFGHVSVGEPDTRKGCPTYNYVE